MSWTRGGSSGVNVDPTASFFQHVDVENGTIQNTVKPNERFASWGKPDRHFKRMSMLTVLVLQKDSYVGFNCFKGLPGDTSLLNCE